MLGFQSFSSRNGYTMYIGEAAKRTGLSIKAIRLYESMGLIHVARLGKYRLYSEHHIELLHLIAEAKTLGLPLTRLTEVMPATAQGRDWARLTDLLYDFRQQLLAEQQGLQQRLARLDHCLAAIGDCRDA